MPPQSPDTPATSPETAGPAETPAPPTEQALSIQARPPVPAVDEQRLSEAEQRASEQSDRAEQLQAALDAVRRRSSSPRTARPASTGPGRIGS